MRWILGVLRHQALLSRRRQFLVTMVTIHFAASHPSRQKCLSLPSLRRSPPSPSPNRRSPRSPSRQSRPSPRRALQESLGDMWFSIAQGVERVLRGFCVRARCFPSVTLIAVLPTIFAAPAWGQPWQYSYDSSGNLVIQVAGAVASPRITRQPQNQIVALGELASFSVTVADARTVAYQWRFN